MTSISPGGLQPPGHAAASASAPRVPATRLANTNVTDKDRVVQQTDIDALLSRCSAVEAGYLTDPFAHFFVEHESDKARRYPLINRGTYIRTTAIDKLVESFLQFSTSTKQIISLGAGSDTRFFRLSSTSSPPSLIYHELDFPTVTSRKVAAIRRHASLSALLTSPTFTETSLASSNYHIHPIDLRTLATPDAPLPSFIDATLPTIFLSECCLIYLSPTEADGILRWITSSFSPSSSLGIILYEPIGGDDSFGRVMIQNLAARGIVLKTLKRYSSLSRQKERLKMLGFGSGMQACDINFIHDKWISQKEKERIDRLEMLDEREEWVLLARHYCVAWGWREGKAESVLERWNSFPLQVDAE